MSKCEFAPPGVKVHHSDDLFQVYHGAVLPMFLCGFHETYYRQEAYHLLWGGDNGVMRAALDNMTGGSNAPVDNKRNALVLRVTKGTPHYAYALRLIMSKRRQWVQWHTNRQSAGRREPRTMAAAERYYRLDLKMGGTPEYLTKRATEFLDHHEKKMRCI